MDMGINDKYAYYAPVNTSILKTNHIDNNFYSQNLSSVLKITKYNNNNNNNKNQSIRNNWYRRPQSKNLLILTTTVNL